MIGMHTLISELGLIPFIWKTPWGWHPGAKTCM